MSDTLDQDFIKELMFDDSFTRSELYFKTLQLLRTFSEWMGDSLASIDYLKQFFVREMLEPFNYGVWGSDDDDDDDDDDEEDVEDVRKATSQEGSRPRSRGSKASSSGSHKGSSVGRTERMTTEDKKTMERNWTATSVFLKAAEARLQERLSRKTEEVKSLRDGVSASSNESGTDFGSLTERKPSFSMPRHSVKPPEGLH